PSVQQCLRSHRAVSRVVLLVKTSSPSTSQGDPLTKPTTQTTHSPNWLWPVAVLTGVVFLIVIGLQSGVTGVQQLADPGALTRWALPATKAIHNIAWSITFGALLFGAIILPRWTKKPKRGTATPDDAQEHPAYTRTIKIAT